MHPFGDDDIVSRYSRAQMIEDGDLIDFSTIPDVLQSFLANGVTIPVAMTRTAFNEYFAAFGSWTGSNDVKLPPDQSIRGRAWDLASLFRTHALAHTDDHRFSFRITVGGQGESRTVELVAIVDGGDDGAPVITILLPSED